MSGPFTPARQSARRPHTDRGTASPPQPAGGGCQWRVMLPICLWSSSVMIIITLMFRQ
jgi:hypothetical protein